MRCELRRNYDFEAAHRLPHVPEGHKCARLHGHSYRITVLVAGEVDPKMGWLMDFAAIDEHVKPIIARLDHRLLNDIEGLENPTSEILSKWMWDRIEPSLPELEALTVSETPDSSCTYRGE
jgi:6-pyruvoyltetrahydropterin/6-carboxytetrahydropterin synthase